MILESIHYQRQFKNNQWQMMDALNCGVPVEFSKINLVVGKNASGKSNTITVVDTLADLVSGILAPKDLVYDTASYDVTFRNESDTYRYILEFKEGFIIKEELYKNTKLLIDRENGKIYYQSLNKFVDFKTDDDALVVTRRDSIQHPYLNPINDWGKQLRCYRFGTPMGKNVWVRDLSQIKDVDAKDTDRVLALYVEGEKKSSQFSNKIVEDMRRLNYKISKIDTLALKCDEMKDRIGMAVNEHGLKDYTDQMEMSSGMFRALSLIIQLEYAILLDEPSCILIDDIGEGLDYDRSTELIKLVIEKAEKSKAQIIMTTNDRFVMNNVPLKYWQVVVRGNEGVCFFNQHNSPEAFEGFKYTGLNNFDFFASKFYNNIIGSK